MCPGHGVPTRPESFRHTYPALLDQGQVFLKSGAGLREFGVNHSAAFFVGHAIIIRMASIESDTKGLGDPDRIFEIIGLLKDRGHPDFRISNSVTRERR